MQKTLLDMMNMKPKPDDTKYKTKPERKPNQKVASITKPAQTTRLSKKLKTTVVHKSDLKMFLAKNKQERELKQNLRVNVPVIPSPSPSIVHESATVPCTGNSLLLNTPLASSTDDVTSEIIERDLSSSAQDGDLANLCGDLLLASEYKNLGDKPMV